MRQAPTYRVVDSACSRVGRDTQTAGTFLSVLCLIFVSVFTASIPASFEERLGYFFLIGLPPALGFYLAGHLLRGMLVVSGKLSGIVASHCLRWQAPFTERLLNWARASVLDLLDRCSSTIDDYRLAAGGCVQALSRLAQKQSCRISCQYRYVWRSIIDFLLLLSNITSLCLWRQARFTNSLLKWAAASVLDLSDRCSSTLSHCQLAAARVMQILSRLAQKQRCAVSSHYRYVCRNIVEFSCLLIRNIARFIITLQQSGERPSKRASCLSFDDMTLLMSNDTR